MSETIVRKEELQERLASTLRKIQKGRLPGWEKYLDEHASVKSWIDDQYTKIRNAIEDEDEILYERAVAGWKKGWSNVNVLLAEEYRATNEDAATWELRYIKWMKLKYVKFECEMGIFYVVPRKPDRTPKAKHWFTVDEMIAILEDEATVAAIQTFKQLPVRPGSLPRVRAGEKHLVANFTDDEKPMFYYNFKGGARRG